MRNGWSGWHLLGAVILVAVGAIATQRVWTRLGEIALHNNELGHFILVPFVMFWLIWVRRERLRLCEPVGLWCGPAMVAAGWAMTSLGEVAAMEIVVQLGAMAILVGCLLSVLGWQVFKAFLPAFALLMLLVPTPWTVYEQVIIPLNKIVVWSSMFIYDFFGVQTAWRGATLTIGDTSLPVLAVCDAPGLRAVFVVAYGFAFGRALRTTVRLLILALVPAMAVAFQVAGTVVIAGLAAMEKVSPNLLGIVAGWILLPLVFIALCGILRLLHWAFVPVQPYSLAKDH